MLISFVCVLRSEWFVERLADDASETLEALYKRRSYAPVSSQGVLFFHFFFVMMYSVHKTMLLLKAEPTITV